MWLKSAILISIWQILWFFHLFFLLVSCSISKVETSGFVIWTSSQFTQRLHWRNPLLGEPGVQLNVRCNTDLFCEHFIEHKRHISIFSGLAVLKFIFENTSDWNFNIQIIFFLFNFISKLFWVVCFQHISCCQV